MVAPGSGGGEGHYGPPSKIGAYASVEAGNAFLVKTTLFECFYTLFMAEFKIWGFCEPFYAKHYDRFFTGFAQICMENEGPILRKRLLPWKKLRLDPKFSLKILSDES